MVNKETVMSGATAPREMAFLLARLEQRLLEAIARRLTAFARPDHLTVLAPLGNLRSPAAGEAYTVP